MNTYRPSLPFSARVGSLASGEILAVAMLVFGSPSLANANPPPPVPLPGGAHADASAAAPPQASPPPPPPAAELSARFVEVAAPKPPPLHVEYAQYGASLTADMNFNSGATCNSTAPCILGSGGGIALRGGYRSPGPWYFGGAYQFSKMNSANLYRLGILQQLRFEMRFVPDIGYRAAPYATWGVGAVGYGNEWGVETGGALVFVGGGVEIEVSRLAVLGVGFVYRPVLLAGWTDTAGFKRETGLVNFLGLDFLLEVRSELGRR